MFCSNANVGDDAPPQPSAPSARVNLARFPRSTRRRSSLAYEQGSRSDAQFRINPFSTGRIIFIPTSRRAIKFPNSISQSQSAGRSRLTSRAEQRREIILPSELRARISRKMRQRIFIVGMKRRRTLISIVRARRFLKSSANPICVRRRKQRCTSKSFAGF